jgi:superfamily I DNA/RNA helicase
VAVGDRRQSIYGFRGADRRAIPKIIERLGATVLPLSISYRCPRLVVEQARAIVPTIEAAPGAPDGVVRSCDVSQLERDALPGDFVVSRTNAPLLSLCWKWIKAGRRAEIRGRDIGGGLASWVRGTNATTIDELTTCIEQWFTRELKRRVAIERDTQDVEDKAECLHALCEGAASVQAVLDKIDRLFSNDDREGVDPGKILLTSTHRAKGLEADRVWLLRDTYCKRKSEEESNLLYVAITRAKRELVFVFDKEAQ